MSEPRVDEVRDAVSFLYGCGDIAFAVDAKRASEQAHAGLDAIEKDLATRERLVRVVRWILEGKPWAAYVTTPDHPAGSGWTLEDEAKDALGATEGGA